MIKDDFLQNIIDVFQKHERFEYVDFKIEIENDTLSINYVVDDKFYISFQDKNHFKDKIQDADLEIIGEASPGKFSIKENFILTNKQDIYLKINSWLDVIWNEISFISPISLLSEEHKEVDEICSKFESMEGYFTTEEVIEIKKELRKLRDEFGLEMRDFIEDEELQIIEMDKLYKDFETLEKTAPFLKKKGWIRSLTGKVYHNSKRILFLHQKNILDKL